MIEKMNLHYSFTNPASVHDEEALTALELAGRQGAKINEVVTDQNKLRSETENHLNKQDKYNEETRTKIMFEQVQAEMVKRISDGTFDEAIDAYMGNLEDRVDNLLHNIPSGSTTMDAEVVDIRVDADGYTHSNAGTAIRKQVQMFSKTVRLWMNQLNYNTVDRVVSFNPDTTSVLVTRIDNAGGMHRTYTLDNASVTVPAGDGVYNIILTLRNDDTAGFKCERIPYESTPGDIIMFNLVNENIIPVGLSPSQIAVNGKLLMTDDTSVELSQLTSDFNGNTYNTPKEARDADIAYQMRNIIFPVGTRVDVNFNTNKLNITIPESGSMMYMMVNHASNGVATVKPTTLEFDISLASGAVYFLVFTPGNADPFSLVKFNEYQRTNNAFILLSMYQGNVFLNSLDGGCVYKNGFPLLENPNHFPYGELNIFGGKIAVDYILNTIKIPTCYTTFPPYSTTATYRTPTSVRFAYSNLLEWVVYNYDTGLLSVEDRNYRAGWNDILIGSLFEGRFTPAQINPACVEYPTALITEKIHYTINDYFRPLSNRETPFKIVLGGDSITHGVGGTGWAETGDVIISTSSRTWKYSPASYCWAKLFKDYIEANYNAEVVNNACTGTDSEFWDNNKASLIPSDTDLFIITIGTNDRNNGGTASDTREEQLERYYNNLKSIVQYCLDRGIMILLCSPIPASADNENQDVHLASCFELNSVVQRVASEYNMEYANLYNEVYYYFMDKGENYASYLPDGLHPGDDLYKIMYYRYMKLFNLAPHYVEVE